MPTLVLSCTADSWLSSSATGTNYGTQTYVEVKGGDANGYMCRGVFRFSQALALPPGYQIVSIHFRFKLISAYQVGLSPLYLAISELNRAWTETGVTWNNWASGQSWAKAGAYGVGDIINRVIGGMSCQGMVSESVYDMPIFDPDFVERLRLGTSQGIIVGGRTCGSTEYIVIKSRESADAQKPELRIAWRYRKIFAASAGLGM